MPVDAEFAALVAHVGGFHITDRSMKRAQEETATAVATGDVDARTHDAYLSAVRHYFDGFQREARAALRDVDKRLEQINQVAFNLTAERAVAVKRIEATEGVLHGVADLQKAGAR
jgi:hypothetical protein